MVRIEPSPSTHITFLHPFDAENPAILDGTLNGIVTDSPPPLGSPLGAQALPAKNSVLKRAAKQRQSRSGNFELIGRLSAWVQKPGQPISAFWLAAENGDYLIKLSKHLRDGEPSSALLPQSLLPLLPKLGETVRVVGTYKYQSRKHRPTQHQSSQHQPRLKLKTDFVHPLSWDIPLPASPLGAPEPHEPTLKTKNPTSKHTNTVKILVCQKSSCRAKGSAKIQQAAEAYLQTCDPSIPVTLKGTGCLGACKNAPCLMVVSNSETGKRQCQHRNLKAKEVPAILSRCVTVDQHL
jgi:(2Fe-2S) ferredoxin